jgi:long-chain acyl-CoA synthetase
MFIKDYDKTALIQGERRVSYSELIDSIKDYSRVFSKYKGKRVALFCENRIEWTYAFFAIWNCGATVVLIDPMSTDEELAYLLDDCDPGAVVTSSERLKNVTFIKKKIKKKFVVYDVDNFKIPARGKVPEEYTPADDETVLILYTSGTSGNSKGVMLSWANISKNIRWNNDSGRINSKDVMIAILPNHHSWPLISTMLCPMDCGATTVFLPALDAETLVKTIKENHITMVTAVPRLFELLHEGIMKKIRGSIAAKAMLDFCRFLYVLPFNRILGRVKAPMQTLDVIPLTRFIFKKVHHEFGGNIKVFVSGGAKLDNSIIRDFRAMGIPMLEGYGLSETAPMVTYHPFDRMKVGSVGVVFDEIDVKFEDDGEILLKGPNITSGYWQKEEDTKEAFTSDGYFKTGDLGKMDKGRYLYLTGRKKDLIILSNGKNVRPDLIEKKIKENSTLVEDVAIAQSGNTLVAIVVPSMSEARRQKISNIAESIKFDVIDEYNREVENYKKIHEIIITTRELPKTRLGKLKRYRLDSFIKEEGSVRKKNTPAEEPDSPVYAHIRDYLKKQVKMEVLPEDHLELDLGLDSLEIVELRLFVEKSFGVKIEESDMALYSIVKELAEYVDANKTTEEVQSFDLKDILSKKIDISLPVRRWMLDGADWYFSVFYKKMLKLKGLGAEKIPDGPCIIAPNHTSYLDSIILYHFLKKEHKSDVYFVAKEKNFRSPLFKIFARNSRVIVMDINRNLGESLQKIGEALRRGKKVVIFPEGTRTRTGQIQRFKNTFAAISKVINVPVIPVVIKGAFKAMPYTKKLPQKGDVSIEFLDEVVPDKLSEDDILQQTYEAISEHLDPEERNSSLDTADAGKKSGNLKKAVSPKKSTVSKKSVKKSVKGASKKSVKKSSKKSVKSTAKKSVKKTVKKKTSAKKGATSK